MPTFYHYTDDEGAKSIIRSGRVQASRTFMASGSAAYGNGVYLTKLNPWQYSKEEIMMNNWGNTSSTSLNKTNKYFILSIPKEDIKKVEDVERNIFLFRYGKDLRLHKYPWVLNSDNPHKQRHRTIASYKYKVKSGNKNSRRYDGYIGDYVMSDEIVNESPVYENSKYILSDETHKGRPVYEESTNYLYMGSDGNWHLGPDVRRNRAKFRQNGDFNLGLLSKVQWEYRNTDGHWKMDHYIDVQAYGTLRFDFEETLRKE